MNNFFAGFILIFEEMERGKKKHFQNSFLGVDFKCLGENQTCISPEIKSELVFRSNGDKKIAFRGIF